MKRQETEKYIDILEKLKNFYEKHETTLPFTIFDDLTGRALVKYWKRIKAFSRGDKIELKTESGEWMGIEDPQFLEEFEYRIKPSKYRNIRIDTKGKSEKVQKILFREDPLIYWDINGEDIAVLDNLSKRYLFVEKDGLLTCTSSKIDYLQSSKYNFDIRKEHPEIFKTYEENKEYLLGKTVTNGEETSQITSINKTGIYLGNGKSITYETLEEFYNFIKK